MMLAYSFINIINGRKNREKKILITITIALIVAYFIYIQIKNHSFSNRKSTYKTSKAIIGIMKKKDKIRKDVKKQKKVSFLEKF